jgi:hypothetical protein
VSHVTGGSNENPLTEAECAALDHMVNRAVSLARRFKAGAAAQAAKTEADAMAAA